MLPNINTITYKQVLILIRSISINNSKGDKLDGEETSGFW